jgi:hypothetical protein
MYFKKLELTFSDINYSKLRGSPYEGYGETFRQFRIKDYFYLQSLIKNKIKFKIRPDHMFCIEINEYGAEPHKDQCLTALNVYIDTCDCVTTYWKPKVEITETIIPGMNNNDLIIRAYQLADLTPVADFKASVGDIYLLNVDEIHSVVKPINNEKPRKILRWMWDTADFETVLDSIEILDKT